MGRPIQKKWFGETALPGPQIKVSGVAFADGATYEDAFIIKQTGVSAYLVQDTEQEHDPEIVRLAPVDDADDLVPGTCFVLATPYGSEDARPVIKITQFRLSLLESDGTTGSYAWSHLPATGDGQADLIPIA